MSTTLLAIESSCDDTSAAVCMDGVILSNFIANQAVHEKYGGVVPELASRAHMQNIVPVVDTALNKAGVVLSDLDAVAFTSGPGLIGSLLIGSQFAKSLALALNKPLIRIHHMQAHVLANLIGEKKPAFPFLCLTVSGGHTQIVQCENPTRLKVIGETLDDAAGEAFDKAARLLGLPYPGGPFIDKYAQEGNSGRFRFPEPQIPGLNFSFSGLKTAFLYFIQRETATNPEFVASNLADICASIQERIITILMNKLQQAALQTNIHDICIAGGVAANSALRDALVTLGKKNNWNVFIPPIEYCTDNAGMIAIAAYYKYLDNQISDISVSASARAEWT